PNFQAHEGNAETSLIGALGIEFLGDHGLGRHDLENVRGAGKVEHQYLGLLTARLLERERLGYITGSHHDGEVVVLIDGPSRDSDLEFLGQGVAEDDAHGWREPRVRPPPELLAS